MILKLLLYVSLIPASVFSQDQIKKVMVGPAGNSIRVVAAFIEPSQESIKTQSMIIDVNAVKNKTERPSFYQVDLTSTVRSLSTGDKNQKILILRWKKDGEIEFKCEGKWEKKSAGAAIDRIVETTKAVIQSVPLDKEAPSEVTLPEEVEKKISSIFNTLDTESLPCSRNN
jgi:hypothetical protein